MDMSSVQRSLLKVVRNVKKIWAADSYLQYVLVSIVRFVYNIVSRVKAGSSSLFLFFHGRTDLSLSGTFHWLFSRVGQLVAIIFYASDLSLSFSLSFFNSVILWVFSFMFLILPTHSAVIFLGSLISPWCSFFLVQHCLWHISREDILTF